MGAMDSPRTDAPRRSTRYGTVRHHPTRPGARDLRRCPAPDDAGLQPGQRQHARLQAEGRGLPQRPARRLRERRERRAGAQHPLRREHPDRRRARRRQRGRRRRRVQQAVAERARVPDAGPGRPRPHRHPRVRDGHALMSIFGSLDVSASALSAERLRMDVTAENLANAQSTRTANGGPYRRKEVVLEEQSGGGFAGALASARAAGAPGGVSVSAITEDPSPDRLVYDPSHPDANAQGYVRMPNVNPVTEMVDLISASRSYEANVTAMQTAKQMFTK